MVLLWILAAHADVATPCNDAFAILPVDGSVDVSPDALPALLVGTCGGWDTTAILTQGASEPETITLSASSFGVHWLDFALAPNSSDTLEVIQNGVSTTVSFETGERPILEISGEPGLSITGAERSSRHRSETFYTVGLQTSLEPDPDGEIWELRRGDGGAQVGVGDATLVDSFWGNSEVCYTLTQFQADSTEVGSADTCTALAGCATVPSKPAAALLGLAALLVRRRRESLCGHEVPDYPAYNAGVRIARTLRDGVGPNAAPRAPSDKEVS